MSDATKTKDLAYYKRELSSLRMAKSQGRVKPYKVCLLLTVCDLIAQGVITDNQILFDDALKQRYSYWLGQLGDLTKDTDTPEQPFFYLESASFWHHRPSAEHLAEYQQRLAERKHSSANIVARIVEFAYLDQALFDYLKSSITRLELIPALRENLQDKTDAFKAWALSVGKKPKTVQNYLGALNSAIPVIAEKHGIYDYQVCMIDSAQELNELDIKIRQQQDFIDKNKRGNHMYSAALNLYGEYLADTTAANVQADLQAIASSPKLDSTEKQILTTARQGQGIYRKNLIRYWGACAITGYKNQRLLTASHIKPWKASNNDERLNTYNGLLLSPNLDKTFDLGYISFTDSGKILISNQLEQPELLGIHSAMTVALAEPHREFLAYHRAQPFKG